MKPYLAALIGLALAIAACGNVAEELAEQAIESQDGGDVDIDFDQGDDGATIEFSDGDDEGSGTMVIGGGELPDDFPVPVPDGFEVSSTSSFSSADGTQYSAVLVWDRDDFDSLVAFYEDYFAGMPDITTSAFTSGDATSQTWGNADGTVSVSLTRDDRDVIGIIQAQE